MDSSAVEFEPQHMRALQHANKVRLARAELKRQIAAGHAEAKEVIQSCPWEAESMKISDLLMSQKRWGKTRCKRFLLTLGIPENKEVGELTERQRSVIVRMLSGELKPEIAEYELGRFRDTRLIHA